MIVALAFCQKDVALAKDLLKWIGELGGASKHEVVLVADAATEWSDCLDCRKLALKSFASVTVITNEAPVAGWIAGSNSLWLTAARHAEEHNTGFWLWLEPDAIPLRKEWLDSIEREAVEQAAHDKFYVGSVLPSNRTDCEPLFFEGVGVYPQNAFSTLKDLVGAEKSWTMTTTKKVFQWAVNSDLFKFLWGEKDNPPTFADKQIPGTNTFSLAQIPKEAVLWHRCKDGSLTRLLRKRMGIRDASRIDDLVLVFPFCNKDWHLLDAHLQWLQILNGKLHIAAVLHCDYTVTGQQIQQIETLAREIFDFVVMSRYENSPRHGWPAAANWAFQRAMFYVQTTIRKPWLWMEPDVVAVRKDWLTRMRDEYFRAGKPFMGAIVPTFDGMSMSHWNGTPTIYPPNVSLYSRSAYTCSAQAFDTAIKDELGIPGVARLCHDVKHMVIHCGAVVNGHCKPANGDLPKFPDQETVDRLIPATCIMFHPAKDFSLIERLSERHK